MGNKESGSKRSPRGREEKRSGTQKHGSSERNERSQSSDSKPSVFRNDSPRESGRAPSGRRFFQKEGERAENKRGENRVGYRNKEGESGREDKRSRTSSKKSTFESKSENRSSRQSPSGKDRKFREHKRDRSERSGKHGKAKPHSETSLREKRFKREDFVSGEGFDRQSPNKAPKQNFSSKTKNSSSDLGLVRLNKYLSNAGIASRRDADNLIISGAVKVNGVVVTQLGTKIKPGDKVTYGDQSIKGERKVYLLLNKPKDYITTLEDERDRKTVMKLVEGACKERIYPVGRLDRNTTGLLLMTNDGELTTKLTHPKHGIKKVYHVSLNKGLKPEHFKEIIDGIELEDGPVKVDDLAFVGEGKKEVGVEIHSGRNRVVRRLFEHLGYDVIKLDRVVFAGLTKKDLPRGKYRFLSAKEISFLQMIG